MTKILPSSRSANVKNSTMTPRNFWPMVVASMTLFSIALLAHHSQTSECVSTCLANQSTGGAVNGDDDTAEVSSAIYTGATVFSKSSKSHGNDNDAPAGMFDEIQEILYDQATVPIRSSERKEFTQQTLNDGWKRGTGGLLDSDRLLLGELYLHAESVFEFGLGESTQIAAHVGLPRYTGVDSDAVWVSQARDASMDHFRFTFADIGKTKAWGNPTDESLQKIHFNYQIAPLIPERDAFDVYLVDGRYRAACACVSLLHAMSRGGGMSKVMVGIHDSDRKSYKEAFGKVAEVVRNSDKLNVYKLKKDVTEKDILDVWYQVRAEKTR